LILLVLKSTAVILATALAAAVLRRRSASTRHFVWLAGLVGALAVPLGSLVLPAWTRSLPGSELLRFGSEARLGGWPLSEVLLAVWMVGAGFGLSWMMASAARLAWVALGAHPFHDPRWSRHAAEVAGALGLRAQVRFIQHPRVALLGTWGILRPHVLLPRSAETWSDRRIRVVLAHELAHARRRDWPVQVLAEAARAIYWFNPLFWLAASRLRAESEHASDDAVVALGIDGADYAEELVGLTRALGADREGGLPALGILWPSQMERRLRRVLDPSMDRLAAAPWSIVVVVGIAVCLTLPIAALRHGEDPAVAEARQPAERGSLAVGSAAAAAESQVDDPSASGLPPSGAVSPPEVSPASLGIVALDAEGRDGPSDFSAVRADRPSETVRLKSTLPPLAARLDAPWPLVSAGPEDPRACAITPTVEDSPPDELTLGRGPWYVNPERTMWVWAQPWVAGQGISTVWVRPEGERLEVSARRLDSSGDAVVDLESPGFPRFKTGAFLFREAGCWEVRAVAGEETLVFVTEVAPFSSPDPTRFSR
jgi:beta-lactamase regulating signal transducer with metallopeptidase domain